MNPVQPLPRTQAITTSDESNPLNFQRENNCDLTDLNNNSIISPSPRQSLTQSSNLFVNESTASLDLNGKSLHLNSSGSQLTAVNLVGNGASVYNNSSASSSLEIVDLRSDEIREDIEILVDIYLLFENATWLLSAFMW